MQVIIGTKTVTIKDSLTWGEAQRVQAVIASGAKINVGGLQSFDPTALIEAKYVLLEIAVTRIVDGDTEVPFTREWMNNLSEDEGNTLFAAVDTLNKKK